MLSTGTGGTEDLHLYIRRIDLDIDILGLRHHSNRRSGGVDTSAGLSYRHTLYTVHAGLILEAAVCALTGHDEDGFLHTADAGFIDRHKLRLIATALRVVDVHAVELRCEEGRLVAAGTATDLHDDVLIIVLVLREQKDLELLDEGRLVFLRLGELCLRELDHLRILLGREHLEGFLLTGHGLEIALIGRVQRLEITRLPHQLQVFFCIVYDIRLRHEALDFLIVSGDGLQTVKHIHGNTPLYLSFGPRRGPGLRYYILINVLLPLGRFRQSRG